MLRVDADDISLRTGYLGLLEGFIQRRNAISTFLGLG